MSRIFDGTISGANETFVENSPSSVYNSLTNITVAGWIKVNQSPPGLVVWVKDPSNTFNFAMQLHPVSANIFLEAFTGGSGHSVASNESLVVGTWAHIALTFSFTDGIKKIHLFVNGVEVTYSTQVAESASSIDDSGSGWFVGGDGLGFGDGVSADIAEFAIWNTVLSGSQLTSLAASTSGAASIASGNLVGYWHLCGSASPEPDATANGNNFTLHGSPLPAQGPDSPGFNCSAGGPTDRIHSIDAWVPTANRLHNLDAWVFIPGSVSHDIDAFVFGGAVSKSHGIDALVSPFYALNFIQLNSNIIPPILIPNFIRMASTFTQPVLSFVNLTADIQAAVRSPLPVNLAGTIQSTTRNYVKMAGTVLNPTYKVHNIDALVAVPQRNFVMLEGVIVSPLNIGPCGSFPDASFVNLRGWIVAQGDSVQMPNSGFTSADDFLSSQTALAAYKAMSVFILNGIALIITAFTTGVVSWQTRTRSWLRRVDAAPNGILLTKKVNTHTLPNGAVITTTTTVVQNQDILTTTVVIQNSSTPTRTSTIVTEKTKTGHTTTIEKDTNNINGVLQTTTRTVHSNPPTTENIQPLKVTTLDGVEHYQFFNQNNPEWAGGTEEGVTTSQTSESITGDVKTTVESVTTPDGKVIETTTVVTGTTEAGTTTTTSDTEYNGTMTSVHKVVTYPNGATTTTDTVTNDGTGDSVETETETVTDEYGQVTTTVTQTETTTFVDPTTGLTRTVVTKNVSVTKNGVTTTDNSVDTTNDFEDDIYTQKIQVIFIQEFTLNVVIDEMAMFGLWEINETQQKNYALLELFGQQLGNLNLSFLLRQSLIDQFNTANACIKPVTLQANGRTYQVVFAPSASAFRAKYIPGTEPHVYELQMILQERSNLINGTQGFF